MSDVSDPDFSILDRAIRRFERRVFWGVALMWTAAMIALYVALKFF
jgi:hypothetical protein